MVSSRQFVLAGFCTLVAAAASQAQVLSNSDPSVPDHGPWLRFTVAERDFVEAFQGVGSHAGELRRAMNSADAEAFDAVMMDVMGALIALPYFRLPDPGHPERLRPPRPRPDRISQIEPDLRALERFFERLQRTASAADSRMFARARKNVQRMLTALPMLMPTISAKQAADAAPYSGRR